MSDAIRLEAVSCSHRGRTLISEISLTVSPGQIVAIIGPNGAGKSTLLRVMGGLTPYKGSLFYGATELRRISFLERAGWVSYVPQRIEAIPPFSVREYVRLSQYRMDSTLGGREIDRALSVAGCLDLAERPLYQLSGGELQRVVIAGAIAQRAKYLLLDEPANAFDPLQAHSFRRLVRETAASLGTGVIVVTHDVQHLPQFASRVVALRQGAMVGELAIRNAELADVVSQTFALPHQILVDAAGEPSLLVQQSRAGE
jgi:iron complex transport system ATP-binding protein